jgi:glycosyltransferase involved in cell wall biosynthesis
MRDARQSILHIGNILNNGYLHCKYLRKSGVGADCLNVDYRHCQGQPEWAEAYITEPVDEFNPDWSKVDLRGFTRPEWFFDLYLHEISKLVDTLEGVSAPHPAPIVNPRTPFDEKLQNYVRFIKRRIILPFLPPAIIERIATKKRIQSVDEAGLPKQSYSRLANGLVSEFKELYPERKDQLSVEDIDQWLLRCLAYAPMLKRYQLIHAYSLDPIYPLLGNPSQPFICYEHGTLREFPFEESPRGRLYSLCLKKAEKVIITNADCNQAADRLRLNNYVFIPHIIDDDLFRPGQSPVETEIKRKTGCEYIFVAPSRHHWKNCPPGLENSWFKRNDILIRGLGRLFRNKPDLKATVIFFEWGQEVDLSKQLIHECGFSDKVVWKPILSKPAVKDYYNAADIILDQFNSGIGTFGAVVPEAMACAKPVILNYKEHLHHWCYPELPPAINAHDEAGIEAEIIRLISDKNYRLSVCERGRNWFTKYHSSDIVIRKMIDVYMNISETHGFRWKFSD